MSSCKLCNILFLNLTKWLFSLAESIYESALIVLDFLRKLSVSFSGDAEAIVKSGIGVIGLKVAALLEDVVVVCDVKKGTGEVTMLFTRVFRNLSW